MARTQADRKERIPLGTPRSKLAVGKREGFQRRWVNDAGGRISNAEEGGYQFVQDGQAKPQDGGNSDLGTRVSRIVGTKEDGSPLRSYLMEISEEFYQDDQRAKLKAVDEVDAAIRRGSLNEKPDDNRYVPKHGIKVES